MKRVRICLWMMIKRMGKHPVYWILLMLFPAVLFVVPKFNRAAEKEQISVGYVMEGQYGQQEKETAVREDSEDLALYYRNDSAGSVVESDGKDGALYYSQYLTGLLEYELAEDAGSRSGKGLFQYIKYTDLNKLKEDIETGEISCGVVFDAEFAKKLEEQDYYHCMTLYLPEGMNVGGMVQEDVFQKVYQVYSAVWYAELLKQRGYQIEPEEVLQKFSEYQKEGKVFAVNYEVQTGNGERLNSDSEDRNEMSILSLRGILAFLTLMSAALGALDGSRDRKRGAGKGIGSSGTLAMAAVGAPILLATLFLAGGMLFANIKMTDVSDAGSQVKETMSVTLSGLMQAGILPELISAFLYGLVLWLAAMVFSRLVPEKLLEGAMPCFLLAALLCCPIFFDLGETIPLIDGLSKLFPITWYLEFWG